VAALAVFEGEVAAEGTLAVVTGQAGCVACCDEVFCSRGGTDLACLRSAGGCSMAIGTGESFSSAVVGVAEGVVIRARVGAGGPIRFLIVTDSA